MIHRLSKRIFSPDDRTLDDFADNIITRWAGDRSVVLDCGFRTDISDPDFAPYGWGTDREDAAKNCARRVREDARGIGKHAPHRLLVAGYDLHYRLMRHWTRKEQFEALGANPNAVIDDIRKSDLWSIWPLKGDWIYKVKEVKHAEFIFQLACLDGAREIEAGHLDTETAVGHVLDILNDEYDGAPQYRLGTEAIAKIRERAPDAIRGWMRASPDICEVPEL